MEWAGDNEQTNLDEQNQYDDIGHLENRSPVKIMLLSKDTSRGRNTLIA